MVSSMVISAVFCRSVVRRTRRRCDRLRCDWLHYAVGLPLLAALLLLTPPAGQAQPKARSQSAQSATVREILDGPELYIDQRQARVNQRAQTPQAVSTGNSRGQLAFDTGAAGRLNRFSQLRLGVECFLLDRGAILVSGREQGCTRSARLSVRGTNYVLAVNADDQTEITVLEGQTRLQAIENGRAIPGRSVLLQPGQRLRLSGQGVLLAIEVLTAAELSQLLEGPLFQGFQQPLPDQAALDRQLRAFRESGSWSPPGRSSARGQESAVARMHRMLADIQQLNRELEGQLGGPSGSSQSLPPQAPADPRMDRWERAATPGDAQCWQDVQSYYQQIARVYRDWPAPKPSRKGRFITRVDFDLLADPAAGEARAADFQITQHSGESAQDHSALVEAQRKSAELPPPPACAGDRLRVYHLFVVEYF